MKKIFSSQAGFTITEMLVVIAISGFIFAVAATGFATFFAKFNELTAFSDLQKGAFECIQTMKYGIPIRTSAEGGQTWQFRGIVNCTSVSFAGMGNYANSSQSILLKPPAADINHVNDWVKFYQEGIYVRSSFADGTLNPPPDYIFPKPARNNAVSVTKLEFTKLNAGDTAKVIGVRLEAKVKVRTNYYRYVTFSTKVALMQN